jgi:hypothetical protein
VRTRIAAWAFAAAAIVSTIVPAGAATGNINVKWYAQALVKIALTPNYAAGFGSVKAVFGAQPSPVYGPDASLNAGAVDFGPVIAGTNYLYKYASHLNVVTNDNSGFNVYAEGTADFYNSSDASTQILNQTLYYLPSVDGTTQSDTNTGYSPAYPFFRTAGAVTPGTPPSITYASYPAPAYASTNATGDYYFDYQLKVPPGATSGNYFVWIVYTVVPR